MVFISKPATKLQFRRGIESCFVLVCRLRISRSTSTLVGILGILFQYFSQCRNMSMPQTESSNEATNSFITWASFKDERWCLSEGAYGGTSGSWLRAGGRCRDRVARTRSQHEGKCSVFSHYFCILMCLYDHSVYALQHSVLSYNICFIISLHGQ